MTRTVFSLITAIALLGSTRVSSNLTPEVGETSAAIEADSYELDQTTGWAVARGEVRIEYGEFIIKADEVNYNIHSGEVGAYRNVQLSSVDRKSEEIEFSWFTETIEGNLHEGQFNSEAYKLIHGDIFMRGPRAKRDRDGNLHLDSARISTCDHVLDDDKITHFHLQTRKLRYSPETERFRMNHTFFRVAGIPVFYWPHFSWHRDWLSDDFILQGGHSSEWGAFAIIGRRWQLTEDISTRLAAEWRSRRGIALSSTTTRNTEDSESELLLYGMRDAEPPETEPGFNRRFDSQKNRYRMQFYHFQDLTENLDLRLQLDMLSDIDMLEEWFEDEFNRSPQPRSYADLRYQQENFTFSILARPRINDFYTVVERLPELRFEMPRQRILNSNFYYQGDNSLAHLNMKWRDFDRPRAPDLTDGPEDYRAWRLDSLHMFYHPFSLGGNTQWIPRAGLRMTHYTRSSRQGMRTTDLINLYQVDDPYAENVDIPIRNYDADGGTLTRWAGEIGMELSRKYHYVWPQGKIPGLNREGVRLITRPYTNYTYIPDPTEDREQIYHFDLTDRIMRQNFVRLGVENRLQTKALERLGIDTVARMNTYADFHLESPDDRGSLGNFATNLELNPHHKFSFNTLVLYDLDQGQFNYVRNWFNLPELLETPADLSFSYAYSEAYRSTELNSMGSTLLDYRGESLSALEFSPTNEAKARIDFPLGEKTAAAVGYGHDFNEGDASRHLVEISRDFHCWIGTVRYQRSGSGDNARTEVSVMLSLKALPGVGVGYGI